MGLTADDVKKLKDVGEAVEVVEMLLATPEAKKILGPDGFIRQLVRGFAGLIHDAATIEISAAGNKKYIEAHVAQGFSRAEAFVLLQNHRDAMKEFVQGLGNGPKKASSK